MPTDMWTAPYVGSTTETCEECGGPFVSGRCISGCHEFIPAEDGLECANCLA